MKVDHIGIATPTIEDGLAVWRDALGLEPDATEEVAEQGDRAVSNTHIRSHET